MKQQETILTNPINTIKTIVSAIAVFTLAIVTLLLPVPSYAADGDVPLDASHFPDAQFLEHVKNHFDTNKDNYLSKSEIANAKYLYMLDDVDIKSLKGVEYLTELVQISSFNKQADLGDVNLSHNTKLTEIHMENSGITSINISGCTELERLILRINKLEKIDLSHNTKLTYVNFSHNSLKNLDISHNTKLTYLSVEYNYLTQLDTSQNTELDTLIIGDNYLGYLDLSHNKKLSGVTSYRQHCQYAETMANDLSKTYSGIDTSRISNVKNGKLYGSILYVPKADTVSKAASSHYDVNYTYDTGIAIQGSAVTISSCLFFASTDDIGLTRMFNPISGEHIYTSDGNEIGGLLQAGWNFEGDAWISPAKDFDDRKPVHRLRNPNTGDHHLTVQANEIKSLVNAGWVDEGTAFYSAGTVPVYVEFNPNAQTGAHNYTIDKTEHKTLLTIGWKGVDQPAFWGVLYTDSE